MALVHTRAARRGGVYIGRVNEPGIEVGRKLTALANEACITPAQLAVLWVKDQPAVAAPIFRPRTMEQLKENLPVINIDSVASCTWMKQQIKVDTTHLRATPH